MKKDRRNVCPICGSPKLRKFTPTLYECQNGHWVNTNNTHWVDERKAVPKYKFRPHTKTKNKVRGKIWKY